MTINESGEFIREQAAPERSDKKGVSLDALQQEAQKLVMLLADRHPGLQMWNEMLRERIRSMHELTAQALNK